MNSTCLEDNFRPSLNVAYTFRKRTIHGGVHESDLDGLSESTRKATSIKTVPHGKFFKGEALQLDEKT